jgi:hypothetical protein
MSYRENQEKPSRKINLQNNREPSLRMTPVDPLHNVLLRHIYAGNTSMKIIRRNNGKG